MKLDQLERIEKKLDEIDQIIAEDASGSQPIKDELGRVRGAIEKEMKEMVWQEHKKKPK